MILCCALSESEIFSKNERIEELIFRLSEGSMGALDELYGLIKTDVYSYALSKCQNPRDAEDIMQDTFVQIYKYAKRYTPQGKPLAWIFTIITNLSIRRFQVNQRFTDYDDTFQETPSEGRFDEDIVNSEFLKQLMQTLDRDEQEIIVLHIVSGLKHKEIADLLGKPLSTVLSRYNRAIRKLKNLVEEA